MTVFFNRNGDASSMVGLLRRCVEALLNCCAWLMEYERELMTARADTEKLERIRATISMTDGAIDAALLRLGRDD